MRGDGLWQSENAADPRRRHSLSASLVVAGLIATTFALAALWTFQMLTGRRVQSQEVSARPIDAASIEVASKEAGELEVPDRDAEPGASSPPVPPSDLPLTASASRAQQLADLERQPAEWDQADQDYIEQEEFRAAMRTRRDRAVPAVESRQPPASSLPRSSRSTWPALEDAEVLFDVPIGGHVIWPVKTRTVAPAYPRLAQTARIGGQVVLEAVITAEGRIADIRVADSVPLFNEAAVAAIRQWQYEPGQLNGIPVPVPITFNVTFSVN